ncbi:hypothetical protein [Rossellomorea marisflavi]|uniref:hypothetical protein n=2 Tax=Rossellomorea marisflavi TaxID=189381 RepID=UPI00345A275F
MLTYKSKPFSNSKPQKCLQDLFWLFLDQLKASHAKIRENGNAHLINGFITIVLFSLFLPAVVFYGIKENIKGFASDMDKLIGWGLEDFLFTINGLVDDSLKLAVITKPVLATLLLLLVMVSLTFPGAKLSKFQASFQVIAVRCGVLLVPFILRSLDQTNKEGLDVVLTALLIFVVSLIVLGLIGEYLFDALVAGLRSINFDDILYAFCPHIKIEEACRMGFCKQCGKVYAEGQTFCKECGAPIKGKEVSSQTEQRKPWKTSSKILLLTALFLIAGLYGGHQYMKSFYTPDKKVESFATAVSKGT